MPNPIIATLIMGLANFLGLIDMAFGTNFAENTVIYINEISAVAATELAKILYAILGAVGIK